MKKILLNTGKKVVKDVIEPLYIESSFIQVYSGVNRLLSKVHSLCAIQLLHWAIERMNKYNTFTLTKAEKKIFIFEMRNQYSISGVNKGLAKLKEIGLIESTNEYISNGDKIIKTRNSMYYVNPNYFWKSKIARARRACCKTIHPF